MVSSSLAGQMTRTHWLINEENKLQEPICYHTSNQREKWQPIPTLWDSKAYWVGDKYWLRGRYIGSAGLGQIVMLVKLSALHQQISGTVDSVTGGHRQCNADKGL